MRRSCFVGASRVIVAPLSSPFAVSGLKCWLDSNVTGSITKDGSNLVSQWNDKSGSGNHATASTTARPTWVSLVTGTSSADFTTFWVRVVEWAAYIDAYQVAQGLASGAALASTYYDAELTRMKLAVKTADTTTYYAMADHCNTAYAVNYVRPASGGTPGYWAFGEGLVERYLVRADASALSDLVLLCANAAYHGVGTTGLFTLEGNYANVALDAHNLSREWSYCVLNYIQLGRCQALTAPQITRRDNCFEDLFRIVDWWVVSKTSSYLRPFMMGLLMQALINYYEYVSQDSRIIPAIRNCLTHLNENLYIAGKKTFYYTDRDGTGQPWSAGSLDRDPNGAPDLNMIIAPAYAWLYKKTGETEWLTRGDDLVDGAIPVYTGIFWTSGSYWGSRSVDNPSGKQFDQTNHWGLDTYLTYANAGVDASPQAVMRFDGTSDVMRVDGIAPLLANADSPFTAFAVYQRDSGSGTSSIFAAGVAASDNNYHTYRANESGARTSVRKDNSGTSKSATSKASGTDLEVAEYVFSGTAADVSVSGAVASNDADMNVGTFTPTNFAIGAEVRNSTTQNFFDGDLYEFLFLNRELNSSERTTIRDYLKGRYGIATPTLTDPVTWDATQYGTVIAEYDFTDTARVLNGSGASAANGETVGTVNAASGSGTLTQSTDSKRPTVVTNALNSRQVIQFDGTDDWFTAPTDWVKNRGLVIVVAVFKATDAGGHVLVQTNAAGTVNLLAWLNNTNFSMVAEGKRSGGAGFQRFGSNASQDTWYGGVWTFDFANNLCQIDTANGNKLASGAQDGAGTTANSDANGTETNTVGAGNIYGSNAFKGQLAHLIFYSAQTTQQRTDMLAALEARHGDLG